MMRKLLSILTILWTQLAAAQPVTTQMQAGRTPDGVVYFLPKTVFHINILVEKTTFTPGEFALYAEHISYQNGGQTYMYSGRKDYLPQVMALSDAASIREWTSSSSAS